MPQKVNSSNEDVIDEVDFIGTPTKSFSHSIPPLYFSTEALWLLQFPRLATLNRISNNWILCIFLCCFDNCRADKNISEVLKIHCPILHVHLGECFVTLTCWYSQQSTPTYTLWG